MHEGSIARGIIEVVEREAQELTEVLKVRVRIGKLHAVVPDALTFFFDVMKQGKLKNAVLEIEEVPVKGKCNRCGKEFEINEPLFLCPLCGSGDVEIKQGQEMHVVCIEGRKEDGDGKNKGS
ncbi:hypothetical protein DRQ16_03815 [bacterium]|nr:MAG: hypothetical protein DRQ16_03815 [bacterium]RKZ27332.1 MAG: hypothetical protein DRQ20_00725 [bacterium]